ncbi:MAG: hypothetical protein BIP78_1583 [Candidatus Bipolaricaulis sibiricus]|uniref:Uncharacterized protein n=1 Tax=Bipolaricaulis sibiricus TaxID=2501609 RepID=A0A410FW85_BIPS1|nr:MAG: hypothetical protein BIP78_1583 [Candidatus Bipolaricaulis sibiricus]
MHPETREGWAGDGRFGRSPSGVRVEEAPHPSYIQTGGGIE